ncbi:MAG: SAM-dependent methyltransferase [Verrucomicrobiota bacterium]
MTGNPELIDFIRARIVSGGPVTFRWFMEQALYHPCHGYYASGRAAIGKQGDFFTSVSVGSLFGKLLAAQFLEMWNHLGRPDPFTLVEQGANNGDFAADVLAGLKISSPDCLEALRYVIIEPFATLRDRQQQKLTRFPQVRWHASLEELQPFCGIHFSNELIDAMPVHRVRFSGSHWHELYVDENFELVDRPLSSPFLAQKTESLPEIENYRTEVNLDAPEWIESLATRLTRGYLLAIDYGYPQSLYYNAERSSGTLACYAGHHRGENPFEAVGEADITAHVDFTSVAAHAEKSGFQLAGFTDQHHFMVGLGRHEFPDSDAPQTPERQKSLRAFQTLMHPNFMGMAFKVLALRKDVEEKSIQGFAFASNPRTALGLH